MRALPADAGVGCSCAPSGTGGRHSKHVRLQRGTGRAPAGVLCTVANGPPSPTATKEVSVLSTSSGSASPGRHLRRRSPGGQWGSSTAWNAATLFDLVKLSFGVVAGAGALVALVVAYRRQHVDEAGAHREATRLHTERFSLAVDKLGSDSPAVRLGGVHALAGLADDAPDGSLRQTCIDVLCAYLQLPSPRPR